MYIIILLLPLMSFVYVMLLGRFIGQKILLFFSLFFSFVSFLVSIFFFYEVVLGGTVVLLPFFN